MTPARAESIVVTSLGVTALFTVGGDLAGGARPSIGQFVGLGVVGVGLAVGASFAPDLAAGFAALIAVTSVFVYGAPFATAVTHLTHPTHTPPRKAKP